MANFLTRVRDSLVPKVRAPVGPVNANALSLPNYGSGSGGWWPIIREPFAGAWQRNLEIRKESVLFNVTVFRCVSLISSDIAKMRMKLVHKVEEDVWEETPNSAFGPVLTTPNNFQNRIQFFENWINSKLNYGNTYVLKEYDGRNVVVGMYVLDPSRTKPLVANNGDVYYQLKADNLAGVDGDIVVPANMVIHDRWNCFYHPLCGLSPVVANAIVATQGLEIQEYSARFFKNSANPGGILTAPGRIDDTTAARLKDTWQERFAGGNAGFVAVLGNGLEYKPMAMTSTDAQLIEQLRWSSETIAASYGVPGYKVGVGTEPRVTNIEVLERQYYQACLQIHIESIELLIDQGLNLPNDWGVEFDLDGLLRMDGATMMKYLTDGVTGGILAPDEARSRIGLGPVDGGGTPYLQQQNYSLAALAKRDAQTNPFAPNSPSSGSNPNSGSDTSNPSGDSNTPAPAVDTTNPGSDSNTPATNNFELKNILTERLSLAFR